MTKLLAKKLSELPQLKVLMDLVNNNDNSWYLIDRDQYDVFLYPCNEVWIIRRFQEILN